MFLGHGHRRRGWVDVPVDAVGWYGTHAGNDDLRSMAADYANALATAVEERLTGHGKLEGGDANQTAT